MKATSLRALVLLLLVCVCAAAVQAQTARRGTSAAGRRLFHSAAASANGLSCAHCHADFDEDRRGDGLIRAGHSLANGARRETWWGQEKGTYPDIAAAAVECVKHFMRNPKGLTSQQAFDLQTYLAGITTQPITTPQLVAPGADKTGQYRGFEGGDRSRGRHHFYAACHACHPNGRAGIAPAIPRDRDPAFYAKKVREGDGLGAMLGGLDPNAYDEEAGRFMPFFGIDRLENRPLRDIIAYIKNLPPAK